MNEKAIWDFLLSKFKNPKGVAAIMGNLMAESSLNPKCANGIKKKYGWTEDQYLYYSEKGEHDFVNDGVAFGLVQWCYNTRKQGLLDEARKKNTSIGDASTQLEYLCEELPKYKTAYNAVINGTDIKEITKTVMLKYEKPANTGESAVNKRTNYARLFYEKFTADCVPINASRNVWEAFYSALKSEFE